MAAKPMGRAEKWMMWLVAMPLTIFGIGYCTRDDPDNPRPPVLNTSRPIYIVSDSGHRPIMKTRDGLDRANKLISDGIAAQRLEMLTELIACRVPVGTRVSHQSSAGWAAERIIVAEGSDVGCEGFVWSDWLANTRRTTATAAVPLPPPPTSGVPRVQ